MKRVLKKLKKRGWYIGTMESCTGGALANSITNIPGSSDVFREGLVVYSNKTKIKYGVDQEKIKKFGVYSFQVAEEMARSIEGEVGVGVSGELPGKVYVCLRVQNKIIKKMFIANSLNLRVEMKNEVVGKIEDLIFSNI
jgi:PncC family amidohydrolase